MDAETPSTYPMKIESFHRPTFMGVLGYWACFLPVLRSCLGDFLLDLTLPGAISPNAMHLLIPSQVLDPKSSVATSLKVIAQLGVILYMFLVGLELNAAKLKHKAHAGVAISHASIVVPFALGTLLSLWLYPMLSDREVPFVSSSLFMGVAMSITAFPVLARILTDRNLQNTPVGTVALSCAAADDVTARQKLPVEAKGTCDCFVAPGIFCLHRDADKKSGLLNDWSQCWYA